MKEKLVCHYTHFEAFQNIINTKKLWAGALSCLNDRNEFRYAKEVTEKVFKKHFEIIISKAGYNLSDMCLKQFFSKTMDMIFDPKKAGYVFCASKYENDDGLLTMWRAYGKNNNGIGIVIRVEPNNSKTFDTYVEYNKLKHLDEKELESKEVEQFIEQILRGELEKCNKAAMTPFDMTPFLLF